MKNMSGLQTFPRTMRDIKGHKNLQLRQLNQLSDSSASDWNEVEDGPPPVDQSVEIHVRDLTKNFSLCYRDIKDS